MIYPREYPFFCAWAGMIVKAKRMNRIYRFKYLCIKPVSDIYCKEGAILVTDRK